MNLFEVFKLCENMWDNPLLESKADIEQFKRFAGEGLADRFFAIKKRLKSPEADIYYWMYHRTKFELERLVTEIENNKTRRQKDAEARDGAELVGENDYWKVYYIKSIEAASHFGKDTRWCVSGNNGRQDTYWNTYATKARLYFYITKLEYDPRGTTSKFALAVYDDYYEIYNQQDDLVTSIPNAPVIEGLPDVTVEISFSNYLYHGGILCSSGGLANKVTGITVESGVTEIAPYAFSAFKYLSKVAIPDGVIKIGEGAFGYCSALKEVTLPESLTTIDDEAFCLCSALKKVVIHENTINIAPTAFKYAKNAVIYCQAKSYAAQYAKEHTIPVQYI